MSKVIAATIGIGGTGTALTSAYALGFFGEESEPQVHKTLNELNTSELSGYSDKVGKRYEYFLVASDKKENQAWWEWSYKRWQQASSDESNLSNEFKGTNLEGAFSTTTSSGGKKTLNKVCDDVYKKETSEVGIDLNDDSKKQLTKDLFKYCSVLGDLPSTVKDESQVSEEGKIGKGDGGKLIATTDEKNVKFWEIKGKWFNDLKVNDQNEYFGKHVGTESGKKSLKDVCANAYGSSTTQSGDSPGKDSVIKYCSLDTSGVTRTV